MSCKSLPAHYRKPESNEQIVLVMPLWAGTFPPAVRTFIEEISRERIILVVTSGSGKITDRKGFVQVIDAVGKNHDIKAITAAIR